MSNKIYLRFMLVFFFVMMAAIPSYALNGTLTHQSALGVAAEAAAAPWFFDVVDTYPPDPPDPAYDVGQHVSIALHPETGKPFISYYEAAHQMLMMAEYTGSGGNCGENNDWECEIIDHNGNVGQYSSIAFNPTSKQPIISYYDSTNRSLKLAFRVFSSWTIKTIHDPSLVGAGKYSSVKRGSTTNINITYYVENYSPGSNDSLWYAKYVGSGGNCDDPAYVCEQVDYGNGRGKYTSLALDSADHPHIAYYTQDMDILKYATYDGNLWHYRLIGALSAPSGGQYASLVIDTHNSDKAHIAHYGGADNTLKYATFVGVGNGNCGPNQTTQNEWFCMDIADMGISPEHRGISIALDLAGYPVIAYQTGTSRLNIARPAAALGQLYGNCGVDPDTSFYTWQCDPITPIGFGFRQGDYLSLAVNSAGLGTITYYGSVVEGIGNLEVGYQRLEVFVPLAARNAQ